MASQLAHKHAYSSLPLPTNVPYVSLLKVLSTSHYDVVS